MAHDGYSFIDIERFGIAIWHFILIQLFSLDTLPSSFYSGAL
jgi:hypothetical protein